MSRAALPTVEADDARWAPSSLTRRQRLRVVEGLGRVRSDPVAAARVLRGWEPHPGQCEVLRALDVREARVKLGAVDCGTGWGKTDLIAELHSEVAESKPGAACLASSRSQEQANLVVKRLISSWMDNPLTRAMVDRIVLSPYPAIHLKNKSYITARTTADNCKSLRGPEWDFVTLDEAAFEDSYAWHFLTTRVRKSNGPVIAFSSPQEEWFEDLWNEYDDAARGGDATVYAYQGPATENPHLHPEYFERMRARLPDLLYRMEVLAEFVGSGTHTFKREHLERIFDAALPASVRPVPGHRHAQGWDLGVEATAAVGYVANLTARDLIVGCHAERLEHTTWPHLQRVVESTIRSYPGRKAIDWTGVGKVAGQNLRVHVREDEQVTFSGPERYALAVDAMKFVEDVCAGPATRLVLPMSGPWAGLRPQMRKHKLSLARKKDSKSLGDSSFTWDELDAFLLLVRAIALAGRRGRGSILEYVA